MIRTVIIEDDPMVAQINRQYLEQLGNFKIVAAFSNGRDAWDMLCAEKIDLVILDIYMPGISGIELLRKIRSENLKCSVIMITAATEMSVVDEALRLGIIDYLIKPFSFARFEEAIHKYQRKMLLLKSSDTADQQVVDSLLRSGASASFGQGDLQKGLNQKTLSHIYEHLENNPEEKHTCESISEISGLSKVTVRRYLNYLIESGRLLSSIDYETGGRPRVLYRLK